MPTLIRSLKQKDLDPNALRKLLFTPQRTMRRFYMNNSQKCYRQNLLLTRRGIKRKTGANISRVILVEDQKELRDYKTSRIG